MPFYDTLNGIEAYLTDLAGINRLKAERTEAGYGRKERLNEFCVLGRWYLDTCGNFSKMTHYCGSVVPVELFDERNPCPKVMTREQLRWLMTGDRSWSATSGWALPPEYAKCTECGMPWDLSNCHDFESWTDHDEEPLTEFVGRPFSEVKKIPRLTNVWPHFPSPDSVINVEYKLKEGERPHNMSDGRPWHYVEKDYIVSPGDSVSIQVVKFAHRKCRDMRRAREERTYFEEVFTKAGFPRVNLITIPNEYGPDDPDYTKPPWFQAQVGQEPPLKIGWRKRVINIDWEASKKNLLNLFDSEDVTKGPDYIHAWTTEKAAEYLAKIIPAITA